VKAEASGTGYPLIELGYAFVNLIRTMLCSFSHGLSTLLSTRVGSREIELEGSVMGDGASMLHRMCTRGKVLEYLPY